MSTDSAKKSEVDMVYDIITCSAGYDVGCAGILSIRQYEYPVWAVEWEEYFNPHDNACKREMEVLEFDDPRRAAECFVELRHLAAIGLDYDKQVTLSEEMQSRGCYLLGQHLKDFKDRYLK